MLAGAIEWSRHKPTAPAILPDLRASYDAALAAATRPGAESLLHETDEDRFRCLLAAIAAFRGFPRLAAGITELRDQVDCPGCETAFATPGYDELPPCG